MVNKFKKYIQIVSYRILSVVLMAGLSLTPAIPFSVGYAQDSVHLLPAPGSMLAVSEVYVPVSLKGIKLHPDNAFNFDFIMDTGDSGLSAESSQLKEEALRVMKYFLTAMTMPEEDLWVNLSPYEKDKIVDGDFGQTLMGRDLLAEDYILKQLTASLIYPEKEFGKLFWKEVYKKAQETFGTTQIPVNTFNKVWIVPSDAVIWDNDGTAVIVKSSMKVMLEEDFLSLGKQQQAAAVDSSNVGSQIVRQIVIPALEKEVNTGKHFAKLRQMYQAMILATWYKKALKESLLTKIYADQKKIKGIDGVEYQEIQKIYKQYIKAFKSGVFNYVKEEPDPVSGQNIPRKYFSGGFTLRSGVTSFLISLVVWGAVLGIEQQSAVAQSLEPKGKIVVVEGSLKEAEEETAPADVSALIVQLSDAVSPRQRTLAISSLTNAPDKNEVRQALKGMEGKGRFGKALAVEATGKVFSGVNFKKQFEGSGIDINAVLIELASQGYRIKDLNTPDGLAGALKALKTKFPDLTDVQWQQITQSLTSYIQTVNDLIGDLKDGRSDVRSYAAQALSRMVANELKPLLISDLMDALKASVVGQYENQWLIDLLYDWGAFSVGALKEAFESETDDDFSRVLHDVLERLGWKYNRISKEWRVEIKGDQEKFLDTDTILYGQNRIRVYLGPEDSYEAAANEVVGAIGLPSVYVPYIAAYFQDYNLTGGFVDITDLVVGLIEENLLANLASEDAQERADAAYRLRSIKRFLVLPALLEMLKEKRTLAQTAGAVEALGEVFDGKDFRSRLRTLKIDGDKLVEEILNSGYVVAEDAGKFNALMRRLKRTFPEYSPEQWDTLTQELSEMFAAINELLKSGAYVKDTIEQMMSAYPQLKGVLKGGTADQAMAIEPASDKPQQLGGVSLNAALLKLNISSNRASFDKLNQQHIPVNIRIKGFLPVIIKVRPVSDVRTIAGLESIKKTAP